MILVATTNIMFAELLFVKNCLLLLFGPLHGFCLMLKAADHFFLFTVWKVGIKIMPHEYQLVIYTYFELLYELSMHSLRISHYSYFYLPIKEQYCWHCRIDMIQLKFILWQCFQISNLKVWYKLPPIFYYVLTFST